MPSVQDLIRQLPPLETLVEKYPAQPAPTAGTRGGLPTRTRGLETAENAPDLVALGSRALVKISNQGSKAKLDPGEQRGLEAIVLLEGRPAILIQEGKFFPPPSAWQVLETQRTQIQTVFRSVGRIEVSGHPRLDWVGTGFLVAPGVVMTNRHVAVEFSQQSGGKWKFTSGIKPRIDYVEEFGTSTSAEFALTGVIGIHDKLDLALLRAQITTANGAKPPQPLPIRSSKPKTIQNRKVYTVGYPAWDGRRNDPAEMRKIFGEIFEVKRLQPGEMTGLTGKVFKHDCSTLGGNSGSCVVDLETHQVLGLHFGGRYLEGNTAVALWTLTGDPLLKQAKVNFV